MASHLFVFHHPAGSEELRGRMKHRMDGGDSNTPMAHCPVLVSHDVLYLFSSLSPTAIGSPLFYPSDSIPRGLCLLDSFESLALKTRC